MDKSTACRGMNADTTFIDSLDENGRKLNRMKCVSQLHVLSC